MKRYIQRCIVRTIRNITKTMHGFSDQWRLDVCRYSEFCYMNAWSRVADKFLEDLQKTEIKKSEEKARSTCFQGVEEFAFHSKLLSVTVHELHGGW